VAGKDAEKSKRPNLLIHRRNRERNTRDAQLDLKESLADAIRFSAELIFARLDPRRKKRSVSINRCSPALSRIAPDRILGIPPRRAGTPQPSAARGGAAARWGGGGYSREVDGVGGGG